MMKPELAARRDALLDLIGRRLLLMGVLNVTPDSFSDGGRFYGVERASARAARLAAEGADIIDVGAESTRPGHSPLDEAQELARIESHWPAIAAATGTTALSIDTSKAAVARRACALGAVVVNDVWGLQKDAAMADAVAETGAILVAMHNRDSKDETIDIVADMRRFFDRSLELAARAGVPRDRIILDPGAGFGKTPRQNMQCVARLPELADYGLPFLVGLSRKSFLAPFTTGEGTDARLFSTLGAHLAALAAGAAILRAHDVGAHRDAIAAFVAFRAAGERHA
ncbi:MAG: dihydropteroate synthase [Methylobacteriaceae bacterium]|nr:dihydropteroate synthase [Methylobacteriaceae bacterium]